MVKASGSQASQLVARGGAAGAAGPVTRTAAGPATRRRSTAARTYFFGGDDGALIKLTPSQVVWSACGFFVAVFMLHIIGKMRG